LQRLEKACNRIVVKIGSSLFCSSDNTLKFSLLRGLAAQIYSLITAGKEVVLVSSGAIALGMQALGLKNRPKELHQLSAAAAIGQNQLMNVYSRAFADASKEKGSRVAQVLLTWEDFKDRKRYLNAKNTILTLLKYGSVPVINENDTVSTDEIKFGDNDRLSALVASLISADMLIILSDVDGLLDRDKKKVIRLVEDITPGIRSLACPTNKKTCVGGMITKIDAAKIAIDSGIPCVIANGRIKDIILSAINEPQNSGTLFLPSKGLTAKKRWIAFGTKTSGRIEIDEGAKKALLDHKSLLCVGIVSLSGNFNSLDIVSITDAKGSELARGKVSVSSKQLEKIKGSRYHKEIVHRDNMVVL
jgi:glutamate 5-kinase